MVKISVDKHTRTPSKNSEYVNVRDEERVEKDECEEIINKSGTCEFSGKKHASKVGSIDDDIGDEDETGQREEENSETNQHE